MDNIQRASYIIPQSFAKNALIVLENPCIFCIQMLYKVDQKSWRVHALQCLKKLFSYLKKQESGSLMVFIKASILLGLKCSKIFRGLFMR